MEGFLIRGCELILSGVRWLYVRSSANQRSASGTGVFYTVRSKIDPEGSAFSSPVCWSCRDVEGFLIRGLELILPGCGGTSALSRGTTLAARWLHESQRISHQPVGLRFPRPAGRYRPGGYLFSSPGCWSCRYLEGFLIRGWNLYSPGAAGGGIPTLGQEETVAAR